MEKKILVVDDEENIRLTLKEALEPLGYGVLLAETGEEALDLLDDLDVALMLLDLKMPDVSGLEILRHAERARPDVAVLILTGHGTVDSAVESMQHGATGVMQKPISVDEIRVKVDEMLDPEHSRKARETAYEEHVRLARQEIRGRKVEPALGHLDRAVALDADRPEAHNLLGVIEELHHNVLEAQKHYRVALQVDSTYGPARANLRRTTRGPAEGGPPDLGDEPAR